METKQQQLRELARKRQAARWPSYTGIGDYHDGAYECNHVSPYTKAAGNVDSPIMIFLQDWCSEDWIKKAFRPDVAKHGYDSKLPTNRNLIRLLKIHFGCELSDVYATNLFPFIKPEGMSKNIPTRDYLRAADEFGIPQIQIIQPKLVICLGLNTFNAFRRARKLQPLQFDAAITTQFSIYCSTVWCQAHTGSRGLNNRGGFDRVSTDWAAMARSVQV